MVRLVSRGGSRAKFFTRQRQWQPRPHRKENPVRKRSRLRQRRRRCRHSWGDVWVEKCAWFCRGGSRVGGRPGPQGCSIRSTTETRPLGPLGQLQRTACRMIAPVLRTSPQDCNVSRESWGPLCEPEGPNCFLPKTLRNTNGCTVTATASGSDV